MLKAIIFDMDGVLIDSEPIHFEFERNRFAELNIIVEKDYHDSFVGTTSQYMWQSLKEKFDLSQSVDELVSTSHSAFFTFMQSQKSIEPIPGIPDLIKTLHDNNIKLAVASSSPLEMINFIVTTFNLDRYFSVIVTGDFVENSKPEPDIFLLAANQLGVTPNECIVIEDSHNGVKAAKAAGMKCVGYKNINSGNQDISAADIITDDFSLLDIHSLADMLAD